MAMKDLKDFINESSNQELKVGDKVSYTKEASRRSMFSGTITLVGVITAMTKKTVTINDEYTVPRDIVIKIEDK